MNTVDGNVLVIGLGLIGGSIAASIKATYPSSVIFGFDVKEEQANLAKTLGVIDKVSNDYLVTAEKMDLIIVSVPVLQTKEVLQRLSKVSFSKEVIITDVGSTKEKIVQFSKQLFEASNVTYIGGHPMAGSHKSGVVAAKAHLFENAFYILTPDDSIGEDKVQLLKQWLQGTRAKFITLQPSEHDKVVGAISHFPHIIAASLVHQAEVLNEENNIVSNLAAGGFRDITRIASSNPVMWKDILIQNKEHLLQLFNNWEKEMTDIKEKLLRGDEEELVSFFESAKSFRDGLPVKQKGAIPSFYDLYVDIPDHPGVISEITGYLAKEKISITNIRIIETRTDIYGALRISFQSEEDRVKAQRCIQQHTSYETYLNV